VHYDGGVVYFNEACQSYSREAGGKCSSVVAVDVASGRLLWRSAPLTSNGELLVVGDYVVAAYGFTAEADHGLALAAVRRRPASTGARSPSAHDALMTSGGLLRVGLYTMEPDVWFRWRAWMARSRASSARPPRRTRRRGASRRRGRAPTSARSARR